MQLLATISYWITISSSVACKRFLWILMASGHKEDKEFETPAYKLTENV